MLTYTLIVWLVVGDALEQKGSVPELTIQECIELATEVRQHTPAGWRASCVAEQGQTPSRPPVLRNWHPQRGQVWPQ